MTLTAPSSLPLAEVDDPELARRVGERDEAAVRLLMRRHNQRLFRAARGILRDDAEAEDVLQDAYIKAIAAIATFRSDARLSTWLTRIVVNESLGRLRRTRRGAEVIRLEADLPEDEAPATDHADLASTPEAHAMHSEARRIIEAKIDELPDAFRVVFILRAVEELSVEETAAVLDIPEATVRTRFFRARGMLRESIARGFDTSLGQAFAFAGERCDRIVANVIARLQLHPPAGP